MVAPSPVLKPAPATTGLGEKVAPVDVMGAMKRQRGSGPTPPSANMTPAQIVENVMLKSGESPETTKSFLQNCDRLAQTNIATFVQLGNTLFMFVRNDDKGRPLPQGTVQMFPFTAEEDVIEQRLKVLPNTLRQLGIQNVLLKTDDPEDITALEQAGIQFQVKQEMTLAGQEMVPMYSVEIRA